MTEPSSLPPIGSLPPDATMRPRDVAALQLHLPTFWCNNPQLWFAQVEATFDLRPISLEISRFRHLLCNLSPEVAQEVVDVIAAPLNDAPYQRLKQSILDRTTKSESVCLRHLLTSVELGDRRPSQLLNSMQQLLRSIEFSMCDISARMHCLAERRSKIGQTVTGKYANAMRVSNSIASATARPTFFRFISFETRAPNLRQTVPKGDAASVRVVRSTPGNQRRNARVAVASVPTVRDLAVRRELRSALWSVD
ncbi:hypothetical protein HPB50_001886 [Hyalomma asiaticum]|uniref:Uncharacterized protein n=1 Tax=Hyalomma asiaticum TaxID=266040 RepID=A0ACB7SWS7_HYAAI|nr:hypothetical protein HPB50_001886 [Hyalomma asiaticum]